MIIYLFKKKKNTNINKIELDLPRYKYVVNVVLGEMRGEGARYNNIYIKIKI